MQCPRDYDCFKCPDKNTGFCPLTKEYEDDEYHLSDEDLDIGTGD